MPPLSNQTTLRFDSATMVALASELPHPRKGLRPRQHLDRKIKCFPCRPGRMQAIDEGNVMADGLYAYFRLNFEQQGKRARDLLNLARSGNAEALARFRS